ncbi:MAG: hypothetical protein IPQ07_24870 [Myxococcales bacterium]|nr:hypothetical protein [Myxococcales bacterium]
MRCAVLVVLCACNPVFGLKPTTEEPPIDAQFFDAPIDAPFTCWAPSSPPPTFSRALHQLIQPERCSEYTIAGDRAAATCLATGQYRIYQGVVDGPLTPIATLDDTPQDRFEHPRMAPEGGLLFVRKVPKLGTSPPTTIVAYRSNASHDWSPAFTVTPSLGYSETFGTPSLGPKRRMMIVGGPSIMREVEIDDAGTMTTIRLYDSTNFPFNGLPIAPNLSPDGLRMTTYAGINNLYAMYVADRASLDQPFTAQKIDLPLVYDSFLTRDCNRIYFSVTDLGTVFFVERE